MGHFVVAPTFYVDFMVVDNMNLSVGIAYRYFNKADNAINITKADNSFAGSIAFSWISD